MSDLQKRIDKALTIARHYSSIDGDHHKTWVIDQMVRALTGCTPIERRGISNSGAISTWEELLESDQYIHWIQRVQREEKYEWKTGIAP